VRLFNIGAAVTGSLSSEEGPWKGPDEFDFSGLDRALGDAARLHEDALLLIRASIYSPRWWDEAHPDDVVTFADGSKQHDYLHSPKPTQASWASERWLRDASSVLRQFVRHIEAGPHGERVFGYQLCSGITCEWGWRGSDGFLDYSPAMQDYFHRWLAQNYPSDEALRQAWQNPDVERKTAPLPSALDRMRGNGDWRDPALDVAAIDFQKALSDAMATAIADLARAAREASSGRPLVGAMYGYTLTARESSRYMGTHGCGGFQGGHLALAKLLEDGAVDFLASPWSYSDRGLGTGHLLGHLPRASVESHGVACFIEDDRLTYKGIEPELPPEKADRGKTYDQRSSLLDLRRAISGNVATGSLWWWTSWKEEAYDDPLLLEAVRGGVKFADQALQLNRSPVAEVAIVIDEEAVNSLALDTQVYHALVHSQKIAWGHIGAPYEIYLLSDVDAERLRRHRLIVVAFCPDLRGAKGERIRRVLCDGRWVLWCHASGFWGKGSEGVREATGIQVIERPGADLVRVNLPARSEGPLGGLGQITYGADEPLCPWFEPVGGEEDICVLGKVECTGGAGLAVRQMPGWVSAYSAAAMLPAELLRALARAAGVHLYSDFPDEVWASRDALAVHVAEGGVRRISLPSARRVSECWTGTEMGGPLDAFEWDFEQSGSALFFLR